ncbi:MAG: InlB B-repeat-containing protein [Acetobacterium sp.]
MTADLTDGGTVSGSADNLTYGQAINIMAISNDGYVFNGWVDESGNTVSTSAKYSVTITGNMSLTASFSEIQYPISATANPGEGGTVIGGGSFVNGTAVTLTATPSQNYNFIRWTLGDSELAVSTNPQYNFTASEATQGNYTAVFEPESFSVNISLLAQTFVAGQIALTPESGLYSYGTVLPLNAIVTVPNPALHFLGWYENGKELSKDQNFDYTVTQATKLSAIFVTDYGVIISYGDPLSAQPAGVIMAPMNEAKSISAATELPYNFVNWTDSDGKPYTDPDGNPYTDSQLSVTVGPDRVKTYVANYAPKSFDVSVAGQTPGGTASSSLDSLLYGQWLTMTAVPDPGYAFVNWTDIPTGIVFSTNPNWTFLPAENVNLQANFSQIAYAVGLNADVEGGGIVAWANYPTVGPYYGDVITAVATPDPDFVFDGWVDAAGVCVSMESTYDYPVIGNDSLTGAFHVSQNTITAMANPATMGTATGGAVYNYKDQATLTATPNTGFGFINWTNDLDDTVITTPSLVVDVANDVTYTANFEILPCPVTLNFIDPSHSTYGSVQMEVSRVDVNGNMVLMPEDTVPIYGDQVVLTATLNTTIPNVLFKDYLDGTGALISYDAVYTIAAIAEPMDIEYDFVQKYTVAVPVSAEWTDNYQRNRLPGVFPQVTQFPNAQVSGNFKDSVTINYGNVDSNLVFDGWYTDTDTPVLVSTELSFSYQLLDSTPLVAKLHLKDIGIGVENAFTSEESIPGVDLIGGSVSGSGYRNVGESFNISTTVDPNYNFENWTQSSNTLSKKNSFTYTVVGQPGVDALPIQANYSPTACYLTLNANPKVGGQAAPSGYYPYGTLVTISQGNQAGYKFSHFEDGSGNTLTSVTPNTTAGTLTLYMTGNTTVEAVYKESSGSEAKKIVEIIAAAATLAAIAAAIYFGGDELLADAAVDAAEVALEDLADLAAGIVDKNPPDPDPDPDPDDKTHVLITAMASPVEAGTVIGGESYRVGEMAVLKATANPGWKFENWTCDGVEDSSLNSMSFLVDEAEEGSVYTAHFNEEFTITTNAMPEIGGTVTPTKTVVSGETATVTATANEGYIFDGWFENDIQVSEDETYILEAVIENHNLTAQFELGATVTLTSDLAAAEVLVTFTGDGCYKIGDQHTVTATLPEDQAANYIFEGWYTDLTDLEPLSTEAIYNFLLEADTTLIASYKDAITITTDATPEEGGTVTPTFQVAVGADATVTATPNEGYVFDGWFENDIQVSADETYILEAVAENHNLTAQFELGANVTLTSDPLEMDPLVTLTGDGCHKIGDETTVTAVLDEDQTENYIFNGWYASLADDIALSTSETYTFTLEGDITLIASYKENSFTVDISSEDVKMGTVTQTGTNPYKLSDSVTVTAVAEKGYKFAYWSDGSSVSVSQLAEYTFDVTDNATLIANFVGNSVKIQVQCDYVEGGTVTSDDVDIPETGLATTAGESITLKAEEKKDYEFEGWYENGKRVEKKDTYTFVAEKNRTLVAAFSHKGLWLLAFPDPIEGGRVYKVYQTSETKDEFYLNAVPLTGYEFVGWYDILGIKVCDTPEYDFVGYIDHIIFGKFQPIQYNVSVDIAPAQGGTISGTGPSGYGKSVTLVATPELGYVFNGYSDGTGKLVCTDSVYTFTTREDVQLTANFSPQTYNVTAIVNDPALGSVSDPGTYPAGELVSLEASPVAGARLVGWFENGQCISQEGTYTFTATADRNLEVDFSNDAFVLSIMADPVSGGTVSGEGGYSPSSPADQISISAMPSPGYSFTAWMDADTGEQVSTLSRAAITLAKDTNLTAVFTPNVYQVNVTSGDGGTATGNGPYNFGDAVTLSARADMGYSFAGWMMTDAQGNQSCVSAALDYIFTLNEDWINNSPINISTTFKNTKGALIIPLAQEYLRGNIARGYHLDATIGDTTTVEAISGYGYEFTNWTDIKGNILSQDAVYTFEVVGDAILMAHFKSTETVKLTVTEESILQGKAFLVGAVIAGEKEVESGEYVMVYAVAYPGNKFLHWVNQNGLKVSNARCHLFRISEDTTLTAVFEKTTHDIRANVDPEGTGYVFGQKTYTYGATATLTAIPIKLHYIFAYWSDENGRIKGAVSPVFRPVVNGTKTYTAHFIKVEHEITAIAVPDQGGTVSGGGFYADGDSVTLSATANEGYQFDGWFVNEVSASTDANWSFNVSSHLAAEAHFSLISPIVEPYLVTATAVPEQGGTVTGSESFNPGDPVTLSATTNDGYQFDGWFVNGVSASTDASWNFNVAGNLGAEAHFSLNPPAINEADRYQPILQNNSGLNVTVTGDLQSILTGSGIPKDTTAYAQLILDKIDPSDIGMWDKILINGLANGQSVGHYFNIRLNLLLFNYLLNTYGVKELSELNQSIQLSIDIGNLINEGKDFRLIRIHNGVAEEIPCQLNGSILSFESQYFSSFALLYTPVAETGSTDPDSDATDTKLNDSGLSVSDADAIVKSASTKNPKTGDSGSNLIVWSWLYISGFLYLGVYLKKRKKGFKLK